MRGRWTGGWYLLDVWGDWIGIVVVFLLLGGMGV